MKYILYCRKSTESEDRQVLSLESQEKELMNIAKNNNLEVISMFKESKSAKAEGRPVFNQVLKLITSGKADAIICWKLDRLARNFIDGGKVIDLLQKGIIKEIRTYETTHLPTDNVLLLAVNFGMANQYIRDLSTNVKRGIRTKLENGQWPNFAPFGYKNDKADKTIKIDTKRSPYVKRIFELYSTGAYTLKQVEDILFQEGLRTKGGFRLKKCQIHRFLQNKFYVGLMEKDGSCIPENTSRSFLKLSLTKFRKFSIVKAVQSLKSISILLVDFLPAPHVVVCSLPKLKRALFTTTARMEKVTVISINRT